MTRRSKREFLPRNGHKLIVGIVARISGCASQKELSLEDQVDHGKEEVAELYSGPIEYRVIATKGKGERLDRPELAEVEQMIRSREIDLLVMEDVGRLIRGTAAVTLWGIAVDHGTRCIAPNDCIDTVDETWEEELIAACRDHVGHNAHTSKRLKKKLNNRFKKFGGAVALPIAGYIKPENAKTYDDWRKDDTATETIREGLDLLKATLNCSAVADLFNRKGFSTGPYCRRKRWDGSMVRRYYKNRLLAGHPGRGFRHTKKHHETGRRVSVKNEDGVPVFLDLPRLAHVAAAELDHVNLRLDRRNRYVRRKPVNGRDPLCERARKRTRFPGQYARCWYCGRHYVWGGNGVTENLMCCGSREWRCWNSVGFDGMLSATRVVEAITGELHNLDRFDTQFTDLVRAATEDCSRGVNRRWQKLLQNERALETAQGNFVDAIAEYGRREIFERKLAELDERERELALERYQLETLKSRELRLPTSVDGLRGLLFDGFRRRAVDSPEFGDLLRQLVPEFHVYLVRLCDGGHLLPRVRIKLDLAGHVAGMEHVPELEQMLTRVITLDLFKRPPQRERIREDVVRLAAGNVPQRQIARQLKDENPKLPVVQKAIALHRKMHELGLDSPYVPVTEPPDDYPKLRRHKNLKYWFEPLEGYERPSL